MSGVFDSYASRKTPVPTVFEGGKRTRLTVSLVNPDALVWQLEVVVPHKVDPPQNVPAAAWASTTVVEVPNWQLDEIVGVWLGANERAACGTLLERIRKHYPATERE